MSLEITSVVSGKSKGAEALGEEYASRNHLTVQAFQADWTKGRGAGPARNREMARASQALIALWDGKSKGTKNMIDEARKVKLRVLVFNFVTNRFFNY